MDAAGYTTVKDSNNLMQNLLYCLIVHERAWWHFLVMASSLNSDK